MKFINTDGMAFIGPGSEWFWTALSGIILAITFIAIYRQLRLQRSANAIEQLNSLSREWGSERLARHRLAFLVALRDGAEVTAGAPALSAYVVAEFWERTALLLRRGHLDIDLVANGVGGDVPAWWAMLQPFFQRQRESDPAAGFDLEWLSSRIAAIVRKAGSTTADDPDSIKRLLDQRIYGNRERIRVEQALRTVIVASPDAVPVGRPATQQAAVAEN